MGFSSVSWLVVVVTIPALGLYLRRDVGVVETWGRVYTLGYKQSSNDTVASEHEIWADQTARVAAGRKVKR